MKLHWHHFRGGFAITPNAGSSIFAFYPAPCLLIVWMGHHGIAQQANEFANSASRGAAALSFCNRN